MKNFARIILIILYVGTIHCCGRCPSAPPPDRTRPTIKCPPNRVEYADPFQINTIVWWDESSVVANDNRDGPITPTRQGKAPGKLFSEGTTTISYHARDRSGNTNSCSFTITVRVLRCPQYGAIADGWKQCHVSYDTRLGSICSFGCYTGHELVGPSRTECLESQSWSSSTQPYCKRVQCEELIPTSGQYNLVDIVCTDSNYYRSICSYNCKPGFSVLPGHSKVRACKANGDWRGSIPICVDTEPPEFSECPFVKVHYAERSKTSGRAWWAVPLATDNSGTVKVEQVSGPASGTELDVGEYTVTYMAMDNANNTATCQFRVVVKQIKCHSIYPLPYTHVLCPTGRIYGALCEFTCDNGTTLNSHPNAECEKTGGVVPYGAWNFGNEQPYCESMNTCPELRPPDNGALACDTWMYGRYCQMLCQKGYVVEDDPDTTENEIAIHKQVLVCGDSGTWYSSSIIPNCQEIVDSFGHFLELNIEYVYFEGDCESAKEDIKSKFIEAFTTATGLTCQPPACTVSAVKVTCGARTSGTNRKKREDSESTINFEVTIDLADNQTSTEIAQTKSSINIALNEAADNGDLSIDINGNSTAPSDIDVSQPQAECPEGSAYKQDTFDCVLCNQGYYHDTVNEVCAPCLRGYYQDEPKQTSCKKCPTGTTTQTKGAYSASQCMDACPAGYNSTTGTLPCTACDLGYYSDTYGSLECTPCDGAKITLIAGATSAAECRDFDIMYSQLSDSEVMSPAKINLEADLESSFGLTVYVKCSQCDNIISITDTSGTPVLVVTNTDQLRIEFNGQNYDTGIDVTGSMLWTPITVQNMGSELIAYSGNQEILRELLPSQQPSNASLLNATLGGEGFIGSLSQMNIWSNGAATTPAADDTCFNTGQGDILNWQQFSELDGSFVLTKSICDVDDNCESSPCQNGGNCTDGIASYTCACVTGFTGSDCEINIDDCIENPCDNDGTCVDEVDGFTCACPGNYTGELCEIFYVDGGWTDWGSSGDCSVTCGTGVQQMSRVCENPIPINGGKECEGDNTTYVACETNVTCINECGNEPTQIQNGSLNCEWTDNETRVCKPTCDEGFDFDTVLFIETPGIFCGPETGYTWNINNPDNPYSQLPSCTPKVNALENKLNYTATYEDSLSTLNSEVESMITTTVDSKVRDTGCVSTGDCSMENIYVLESAANKVTFTVEFSCFVTGDMDQCYDLLSGVVTTLNSFIDTQGFKIQYNGDPYDVISNSSNLSGVSVCPSGYVPVWQYCVACGKGMYSVGNNYCESCQLGYYQDEQGQMSCKQCPDGWTTAGLTTRDAALCNVALDSDAELINWLLIGLSVGGSIIFLMIFFFVVKRLKPAEDVSPISTTTPRHVLQNANRHFQRRNLRTNTDISMTDFNPPEIGAAELPEKHPHPEAFFNPAYEHPLPNPPMATADGFYSNSEQEMDVTNLSHTGPPDSPPPVYRESLFPLFPLREAWTEK